MTGTNANSTISRWALFRSGGRCVTRSVMVHPTQESEPFEKKHAEVTRYRPGPLLLKMPQAGSERFT